MDFKAVIELVKYTLTLTAGCFVYSLEKFSPLTAPGGPWLILALLVIFAVAAICGVVIFSMSTAALHDKDRAERQRPQIKKAAIGHVGLLVVGMSVLSLMLGYRLFNEAPKPPTPCCEAASSTTPK